MKCILGTLFLALALGGALAVSTVGMSGPAAARGGFGGGGGFGGD